MMAASAKTSTPDPAAVAADGIERALHTLRSHLGMDVAFISEFSDDKRMFKYVDAKMRSPISRGDCAPLDQGYCRKVVDGILPELMPDTGEVAEALALPETRAVPIGAHIAVPLRLASGRLYGTLCCFSFHPDPSLDQRDLNMMRAFADLAAYHIEADLAHVREYEEKTLRIDAILKSNEPSLVYQPVFRLSDMSIAGVEALSRFKSEPVRSPDVWFAEAGEVGLKTQLELKTMRASLQEFLRTWKRAPMHLALNSSPQTIIEGNLPKLFYGWPAERIILEITEHDFVEDYDELNRALAPLRASGVKIAIDDAGSGYASMRHILHIAPDFIKLDTSLTGGIDRDDMKRALAGALITFSRQTNRRIIAEGVENTAELETLRTLGVHAAQGFHLGRPMALDALGLVLRRPAACQGAAAETRH